MSYKTRCKCGGRIQKVSVGFTHRWTCGSCQADYGYGTDEPIVTEEDYLKD